MSGEARTSRHAVSWDAYYVQLASDALRNDTLMSGVDREALADDLAGIAAALRSGGDAPASPQPEGDRPRFEVRVVQNDDGCYEIEQDFYDRNQRNHYRPTLRSLIDWLSPDEAERHAETLRHALLREPAAPPEPEPDEPIGDIDCPRCGLKLEIVHGEDEGIACYYDDRAAPVQDVGDEPVAWAVERDDGFVSYVDLEKPDDPGPHWSVVPLVRRAPSGDRT